MRTVFVEDGGLTLTLGEQFQHSAHVRPGTPTGQLAVAKRTRTAFAKQIIAFRIKRATRVESLDIVDAVAYRTATLQQDWLVARFRQEIRRHQTAGTGADDDRALLQGQLARFRQ